MRYTQRLWVHVICIQVHLACVNPGDFQTRRATMAAQLLPVQIDLNKLFTWKSIPPEEPDGQLLKHDTRILDKLPRIRRVSFANSG